MVEVLFFVVHSEASAHLDPFNFENGLNLCKQTLVGGFLISLLISVSFLSLMPFSHSNLISTANA